MHESDYSAFTVTLQQLVSQIQGALRDKKLTEADRCVREAMTCLARIHGYIGRKEREGQQK